MRTSYIATASEASALHSGEQTAIIVKMKVQPPAYGCRIVDNQVLYEDPQGNVHSRTDIPYAINDPVYVREKCYQLGEYKLLSLGETGDYEQQFCTDHIYRFGDAPNEPHRVVGAASMPRSAARTWFRIISCEAVRVRDVHEDDALNILECKPVNTLGDDYYNYYRDYMGSKNELDWPWFGETKDGIFKSWKSYIIHKLGQSAWDNNDYIFYYKIEKI